MSTFFNQYSFVLFSILLVIVTGTFLIARNPRKLNNYVALAALIGGLAVTWALVHPRQVLPEDARRIQEIIGGGRPVLLEFQSPYCIACTLVKPSVDALQAELGDRLVFVRINIQDPAGQSLAREYGFAYTPTFIFFDAQGNELWRQVGGLDSQRVRDSLP